MGNICHTPEQRSHGESKQDDAEAGTQRRPDRPSRCHRSDQADVDGVPAHCGQAENQADESDCDQAARRIDQGHEAAADGG